MRSRLLALFGALLALLLVTGCGGGGTETEGKTPRQVLAAAKAKFDAAQSVQLTIITDDEPKGDGLLSASGTLTRQPAFEGEADVVYRGIRATIPATAIGNDVYVKLPLTTGYSKIDPADFGIPNPADFIDPDQGISTLLTKLKGLKKEGQKRDGDVILTEYSGTLTAESIKSAIGLGADGDFDTVVGIDQDGEIHGLQVTGPFFGKGTTVTYRISISDYGKAITIKKP